MNFRTSQRTSELRNEVRNITVKSYLKSTVMACSVNESQVHFDYKFSHLCTIYKMSGRSLSVYKDTSASHEYLCALIKNGHEFCKLLLKRTQIIVQ